MNKYNYIMSTEKQPEYIRKVLKMWMAKEKRSRRFTIDSFVCYRIG